MPACLQVLLLQNQFERFVLGQGAGVGAGQLTAIDTQQLLSGGGGGLSSAQPLAELESFMCLATTPGGGAGTRYIDAHSHVWTADVSAFPPAHGVSVGEDEAGWSVESWTGDNLLAAAAQVNPSRA